MRRLVLFLGGGRLSCGEACGSCSAVDGRLRRPGRLPFADTSRRLREQQRASVAEREDVLQHLEAGAAAPDLVAASR